MEELLKEIESYWDRRSDGYCQLNVRDLNNFKRKAWIDLIEEYRPNFAGQLRVLDVGTGPGFFAILLASRGYRVTAVDYTEAMLERAKRNSKDFGCSADFRRMDAQSLEFEDGSFDLIVTRNLMWDLERPETAYREWHRVLAPGGRLLNFDANWYLHVYDAGKRKEYELDRANAKASGLDDHYTGTNTKVMEDIARKLPLSRKTRPQWDVEVLLSLGFGKIMIENDIGKRVWDEEEKVNYRSTPMFMVGAEK